MILADYMQLAIAGVITFRSDIKKNTLEENKNLLRHVIINSLLSNKKKFTAEYGEFVLCCDGKNYWRKDVFPYYKFRRKLNREASDLPWDEIHQIINEIFVDIQTHFPWKTIIVERAEADDIIAVLTKYTQTNNLKVVGLYEEPQPVLAISSDGDNYQLQKYENYNQFCPKEKKMIKRMTKKDYEFFVTEHAMKGDGSDGIPNIFVEHDFYKDEERERQPTVKTEWIESVANGTEILDLPAILVDSDTLFKKDGTPKRVPETEEQRLDRLSKANERFIQNIKTVSYDFIPNWLEQDIINTYTNTKPNGSKSKVMDYLIMNRCKNLLADIQDF